MLHRFLLALLVLLTASGAAEPPVPPTSDAGTWTRLSRGTGAYGWYFSHASVEPCGQGRIWHTWDDVTYFYDPASARFNVVPTTNKIGWRENFGSVWDCEGNAVWIGSQVSKPGPFDGYAKLDLGTMTYSAAPSAGGSMQVQAHDPVTRTLFSFAGWVTGQLKTRPSTDTTTAWTTLPTSPGLPAQNQDSARMTQLRGGRNSRTGMVWYIGDDQVLRTRIPGQTGWTTVATTGPTPPAATVFALHEGSNTLVGWSGCAQVTDPCARAPRQTYLLDLATNAWRLGPSGASAPGAAVMAKYIPAYDKVRDRVVLLMASDERTEVWAWTPSGGPPSAGPPSPAPPPPPAPPPAATHTLTVVAAGPGTVSSSPGGPQIEGTPMTLTATANAGATAQGWSAGCSASMPMPAANTTCTHTFVSAPPPTLAPVHPPPPTPSTAGPMFLGKPLPDLVSGQPPRWAFSRGGNTKDVPCVNGPDGKVICGTGDFTGQGSDSGQNVLFAYDPAAHSFETIATYCAGPGQISPNHSSDKGPFFYRPLDNALYVSTEIQFPNQAGQTCTVGTPNGSTYTGGLLKYDLAARVWSQVRPTPLGTLNIGHYDAASDTHLHVRSNADCGGGAIWGLHVATGRHTKLADLCTAPPPSFSSGIRAGYGRANLSHYLQQFAWDPVARRAYIVLTHPYYHDVGGSTSRREAFLWQWDRASNQVTLKAKPPVASTVAWSQQADYSINPNWMPGVGVVWPVITDPCAQVKQVLVYDPGADRWTNHAVGGDVTQDIRGSSQLYVPGHGVMVVGSVFCSSGNQQYVFFWR